MKRVVLPLLGQLVAIEWVPSGLLGQRSTQRPGIEARRVQLQAQLDELLRGLREESIDVLRRTRGA